MCSQVCRDISKGLLLAFFLSPALLTLLEVVMTARVCVAGLLFLFIAIQLEERRLEDDRTGNL